MPIKQVGSLGKIKGRGDEGSPGKHTYLVSSVGEVHAHNAHSGFYEFSEHVDAASMGRYDCVLGPMVHMIFDLIWIGLSWSLVILAGRCR
jgi:hypothetical protein